jgi:hypothetical protein
MKLPKKDVELLYKLYFSLLHYANTEYGIIDVETPEEIRGAFREEVRDLKDMLYDHPELINKFVEENPFEFSSDELDIVREWKHFVRNTFIVFRSLKKYTIFLDVENPPKAYGVLALYSSFEELVGPLPVMVEAVLLPFKGKIIYDGTATFYQIKVSSGFRRGFNDTYQEAKFRNGVIEFLPFSERGEKPDEDELRFYLKSERNRDRYWNEIWELIDKNPGLITVYHQEMGKVHSRTLRKDLRKIGILKGWFAILEGVPVASGETRDDTERIVKSIVPEKKQRFVYYFQLKNK